MDFEVNLKKLQSVTLQQNLLHGFIAPLLESVA